ncbi:MAG: type II toxin-antitoxin system Phd/YefM family antitoxin [Janthinobacterium lividum]
MSDFLRNHKSHVARLKETRVPEVLTVNGRAEVVLLDTETYENLMERLNHVEAVAAVRAVLREAKNAGPTEEIPEAEMERRQAVMQKLVEETERLGLYR